MQPVKSNQYISTSRVKECSILNETSLSMALFVFLHPPFYLPFFYFFSVPSLQCLLILSHVSLQLVISCSSGLAHCIHPRFQILKGPIVHNTLKSSNLQRSIKGQATKLSNIRFGSELSIAKKLQWWFAVSRCRERTPLFKLIYPNIWKVFWKVRHKTPSWVWLQWCCW